MIRRRRVIYVHGYDPQGAVGYYGLFRSQIKRASAVWGTSFTLGDLKIESTELASWTAAMSGPNWQVDTQYDFVRYEDMIDAQLAAPVVRRIARTLYWMLDDLISGTTRRIIRANFRFQLHFAAIQAGLLLWLALAVGASVLTWWVARLAFDLHPLILFAAAAAVGIGAFVALRPLADKSLVTRVMTSWPLLRDFGRGEASDFDRPIEAAASRLKAAVDANDADEIVMIGHSGGTPLVPCALARALERDPELGRRGPPILLLTVGAIMPAVGLHPTATRMREAVRRIAIEPSVQWVDAQARKDVMNFWDFDPVTGLGIDVGAERCNPLVWRIRLRDMLSADGYRRLRARYFRLHYQFIMANAVRAPYDFFMLVCGPLPALEWARRDGAPIAEFSSDGAHLRAPAPAQNKVGGGAELQRRVGPEQPDFLPADDPRAVRVRGARA